MSGGWLAMAVGVARVNAVHEHTQVIGESGCPKWSSMQSGVGAREG